VHRLCYLHCLLLAVTVRTQVAPAGVPRRARFEVTGGGIADLVFNGEPSTWMMEMGRGILDVMGYACPFGIVADDAFVVATLSLHPGIHHLTEQT
jgi:hypothetical protein